MGRLFFISIGMFAVAFLTSEENIVPFISSGGGPLLQGWICLRSAHPGSKARTNPAYRNDRRAATPGIGFPPQHRRSGLSGVSFRDSSGPTGALGAVARIYHLLGHRLGPVYLCQSRCEIGGERCVPPRCHLAQCDRVYDARGRNLRGSHS
jgi:hypothetical protein